MGEAFAWWLTLELLGIIALPVAAVLLRPLPDKGYATAKILGLLLTGWLAYTLAMMQLSSFGKGLLIVCAIVVAGFSSWLLWRKERALLEEMRALYRTRGFIRYVIVAETLFTLAFAVWAFVRAYSPDIFGTEKFMDFGFMNAIGKSGSFPPNDPWLAGNPINYYYFGYVLMTSLSLLSGVGTEFGFNLANVSLFALTALGVFGVVFNLIGTSSADLAEEPIIVRETIASGAPRRRVRPAEARASLPVRRARAGMSSQASTSESSSATAVLESPRTVELGGNGKDADQERLEGTDLAPGTVPEVRPVSPIPGYEVVGQAPSRFPSRASAYVVPVVAALMVVAMGHLTTLFAVKDAEGGNAWRFCFMCQTAQTFDWWGPSRVILDARTVTTPGESSRKEVDPIPEINEFPAFSFLLADLHPHVMALPLWTLAILSAYSLARRRIDRANGWRDGVPRGLYSGLGIALTGIIIGALYTTNTWDYPTFLLIALTGIALPYMAFQRGSEQPRGWHWTRPWLVQAALLVVLSLVSFLLFHLTFKSLVGGEKAEIPENLASIPVVEWVLEKLGSLLLVNTWDKGITGFLMIFGIFLVAILVWLGYELFSFVRARRTGEGATTGLIALAVITAVSLLLAFVFRFPLLGLLLPMSAIAIYLIWREPHLIERNLVLAMLALAALIGLIIEVVYLRDVFHSRQNTIFKFYYQIWMLWAIAAAYGVWRVVSGVWTPSRVKVVERSRQVATGSPFGKALTAGWLGLFGLLVFSGLVYSVYGAISRGGGQNATLRGLDGIAHLATSAPGDYAAIQWLRQNGKGSDVILECCRDEYNNPGHAGRVSSYTGVPTLVSWDGHEGQWRGGQPNLLAEIPARRQLVDQLYTAPGDGQHLLDTLRANGVDYVFVGATERGEGPAAGGHPEERVTAQAESVYKQVLTPVFTAGSTVIYKVPSRSRFAQPASGSRESTAQAAHQP